MLKRFLPKSLYARVALIVILPIFLMQSFITYVFFDRHWELVSANLSANVAGQIALISRLYREGAGGEGRAAVYAAENLDLTVRFEPGATIPPTDKMAFLGLYNRTFDRELDDRIEENYWLNTASWPAYIEVRVQLDDGALVFYARRDRVYATTGPIFVLWLIGATLLLGWIAIVFLRNQVRSILRLASAAEAFGRGRDAPDFRPSGATEVRRAGRAFIAMRERIKRHLQQRTTMLAGVSHDLKTPLTRMKLALAMQPDTPDTIAMRADVEEMAQMLEGYLEFARGASKDEDEEEVDVAALAAEIAAGAARAGREVAIDRCDDGVLLARRGALSRAVTNLVNNGLKYADNVWLSVVAESEEIDFIIDDDGAGIAPENYEAAFRPFVRLDEARGQNVAGVGLGLSVVRDVARSHGGEVALAPSPRGGLRATLRIPR